MFFKTRILKVKIDQKNWSKSRRSFCLASWDPTEKSRTILLTYWRDLMTLRLLAKSQYKNNNNSKHNNNNNNKTECVMYAKCYKCMYQMYISNVAKSKCPPNAESYLPILAAILSGEFRPSSGKHWSAKLPLKVDVLTTDRPTNGRTVYFHNLITQCSNSL